MRNGDDLVRPRRFIWSLPLMLALLSAPAHGQDLEAGKTPAQLFASNCAGCHQSPRGLARAGGPGLVGFLRQHYTTNAGYAATLAAYLAGVGGADPRETERRTHRDAADRKPPADRTEAERPRARESAPARREEERRARRPVPERSVATILAKRQRYLDPPGLSSRRQREEKVGPAIVSSDPEPVAVSREPVPVPPPHELPVPIRPPAPSPRIVDVAPPAAPAPAVEPAEIPPSQRKPAAATHEAIPVAGTAAAARAAARAATMAGAPTQPAATAPLPTAAPAAKQAAPAVTPSAASPAVVGSKAKEPAGQPDSAAPEPLAADPRPGELSGATPPSPLNGPTNDQSALPAAAAERDGGSAAPAHPAAAHEEGDAAERSTPADRAIAADPAEKVGTVR
ncbi:MAG TPA: hypothetical protein VFQ27_04645 [Xanthobacteraceae bacterium]|nr:hypothetical protein [Xanthobacteraceae bacterium]